MIGRLLRPRRGQGLVETAVALNVLLLLTLGVVDFGRAIWIHDTLGHLAREGARFGVSPARTCAEIRGYVVSRAVLPNFSLTNVTAPQTPAQRGTPGNPSAPVVVTVTYQFDAVTPLVNSTWGGGPLTLQASSRMYVEQGATSVGACP